MATPGCPERRVVAVKQPDRGSRFEGRGIFLQLECGHQLWRACRHPRIAAVAALNGTAACFAGCYVPQRAMFAD